MTIRVAACQIDPSPGEVDRNLEHIERVAAEAARQGAELIVLPEAAVTATCSRPSTRLDRGSAGVGSRRAAAGGPGGTGQRRGARGRQPRSGRPRGVQQRPHLRGRWASLSVPEDAPAVPRGGPIRDAWPGRARGLRPARNARRGPDLLRPPLPGGGTDLRPGGSRSHRPADQLAGRRRLPPGIFAPARAAENHVYLLACDRVGEERGTTFIGRSILLDTNGKELARASDTEEETIAGDVDWELARQTHHRRIPGEHEWDTIGDRRPGLYHRLLEPARDRHPPAERGPVLGGYRLARPGGPRQGPGLVAARRRVPNLPALLLPTVTGTGSVTCPASSPNWTISTTGRPARSASTPILLSPMYPVPGFDVGYDISDYRGIDPAFGSMATSTTAGLSRTR